jgi:hypothetical protein
MEVLSLVEGASLAWLIGESHPLLLHRLHD